MKKTLLILIALLLANINSAWSLENSVSKDVKIKKERPKDPNEVRPRTPVLIPITCIYNDGTLHFTFLEDLGEMEITVTNPSLGVVSVSEYDSAYGSVAVSASSESGSYLIEIVTETGEYYYGEYTL